MRFIVRFLNRRSVLNVYRMSKDIEKTNSGVKKKGKIEEVAKFAREVEDSLDEEVEDISIDEFDKWRPREEDGKEDIERKTVEAASIKESSIEKESNGVKDFSEAGKKTLEAGKKLVNRDNPNKEIKEASKKAGRPIKANSRKMARSFERQVYSKVMIKLNPYFFDAKEFSADLRTNKDGSYSMEVNIPDADKRNHLKNSLEGKDN